MHTPGPWRFREAIKRVDGGLDYAIVAQGNDIIAECFEVIDYGKTVSAGDNARLVATTPDLLIQLKVVTSALHSACLIMTDDVARKLALEMVAEARGVIAKATGQS